MENQKPLIMKHRRIIAEQQMLSNKEIKRMKFNFIIGVSITFKIILFFILNFFG